MIIGVNVTEAIELTSADRRAVFAGIKATGVNTIRVEFPWEVIHTSYVESDAVVADAKTAGLELVVMVAHPPSPTPTAVAFGGTMNSLALHYPTVKYFEIWNEENGQAFWPKGNPETFVPYLQQAWIGIKAANKANVVILGGLAACPSGSRLWYQFWLPPFTNVDPVEFLTRLYAAGGGPFFDVVALHSYCVDTGFRQEAFAPTDPYIVSIYAARALMNAKGDSGKSMWDTEYGFQVTSALTPGAQQSGLAAQTSFMNPLVARGYIYCWRDNNGATYGLSDKNNNARPALAWLKSTLATSPPAS